jgi:hypothetical protein
LWSGLRSQKHVKNWPPHLVSPPSRVRAARAFAFATGYRLSAIGYRLSAFSAFSVFGIGVWGCCLRLVESPAASSHQKLQLLVALLAASRPWPGLQKPAPFAVLCALSSPLCGVHATEDLRRGHRRSRALGGIGRQLRVRRGAQGLGGGVALRSKTGNPQ